MVESQGSSEALKGYYYNCVVPSFQEGMWDAGERLTEEDAEIKMRELSPIMLEQEFDEKTEGVIRLGLHMISSFSSFAKEDASKFDESKIEEIANRMYKDLTGKSKMNYPDLMLCWKIPSSILKQGDKYGCETYPCLWTVAKIYPPLEHQGAKK
jgi:hypothetical protein